jgi:hypothetical protein
VRLSPLGTSVTNWPIVQAPDDRWWWMYSSRWNENWQGKQKYSGKTCSSSTLSTTNPTWARTRAAAVEAVTNSLSYGTVFSKTLTKNFSQDRPKVQAVNRQLLTTKAGVQFEDSPCWICGGWSENEAGHFGFPLPDVILPMFHRPIFLQSRDGTLGQVESAVPRHSILAHSSDIQPRTSGQNIIRLRFEPGSTRKVRRRLKI